LGARAKSSIFLVDIELLQTCDQMEVGRHLAQREVHRASYPEVGVGPPPSQGGAAWFQSSGQGPQCA
jgi:hypothetical protein